MKIEVTVDTERFLNIPWPDGVPLPNAGDFVLMQLEPPESAIGFVVISRFFGIGTGIDGQPLTVIRIEGKRQPA